MYFSRPFCASQSFDLFGLSLHLEDEHPRHAVLVTNLVCAKLPVIEVDIDRAHEVYGARALKG